MSSRSHSPCRLGRTAPLASAVALTLALGVASHAGAQTYSPAEARVKAVLLYNFGKFIRWPAKMAQAREFTLCVVGEDPFGAELNKLAGEKVRGKPLAIKRLRVKRPTQIGAHTCHILFISPSENKRLVPLIRAASGTSALTVGDTTGFARRGGAIGLRLSKGKVSFAINRHAATGAGLRISARLLKIATIVTTEAQPPRPKNRP